MQFLSKYQMHLPFINLSCKVAHIPRTVRWDTQHGIVCSSKRRKPTCLPQGTRSMSHGPPTQRKIAQQWRQDEVELTGYYRTSSKTQVKKLGVECILSCVHGGYADCVDYLWKVKHLFYHGSLWGYSYLEYSGLGGRLSLHCLFFVPHLLDGDTLRKRPGRKGHRLWPELF